MVQRGYTADETSGKEKDCVHSDSCSSSNGGWILAISGYAKALAIIVVAVFILSFRSEVMTRIFVSGDSMNPTYRNGDVVFLWEYEFQINRYDIVVARTEKGDVIKRVIGLPGDRIVINGGYVYINGIHEQEFDFYTEDGGIAETEICVSDGCYFLLGDNRQDSIDSREFGEVTADMIKGVVVFKIFPPF